MTIIKPNEMPRGWWLFPWSYARTLHRSINALRALSDRQDAIIQNQRADLKVLWKKVDDLQDSIIRGTACIEDARPIPEDCES